MTGPSTSHRRFSPSPGPSTSHVLHTPHKSNLSDNSRRLFAASATPKVNQEDFKIGMNLENSSSSLEMSANPGADSENEMGEELVSEVLSSDGDLASDENMSSDDATPDLEQSGPMVSVFIFNLSSI